MIEVEVHSALKGFLREQGNRGWPHHLTMARLVARTLRLGRSALMQTGSSSNRYCPSYLMPVLLGDWSVILVVPQLKQVNLIDNEIPHLQKWLGINKQVRIGEQWQTGDQLLITSPQVWLGDRLSRENRFPHQIPTIIDHAEDLETWAIEQLTISLEISDWDDLLQANPQDAELIRNCRVKLTKAIFDHPTNPYKCYLLEQPERDILVYILRILANKQALTAKFDQFWHLLDSPHHPFRINSQPSPLLWVSRQTATGFFSLHIAPAEVAIALNPIWYQQPIVLIGSFLDREPQAPVYREKLGLPEMLCLQYSPNRQQEHIKLYLPDRFPLPNNPQFRTAFIEQARILVGFSRNSQQPAVLLIEDVPLRAQVASALAAQIGSQVQVDTTEVSDTGILVTGWQFWKQHQDQLPIPKLLIIATLPLPSLENPLVASRVAYLKRRRKDWFRLYLLPTALNMIQQTIIPLRESQGIIALLDNRVNFRSYGKTILSALEPCARINYIDPTWFHNDS
ncbi:MAG: helicase C-terminal domain-containing protein [Cyanobacteria bacterium P01_F01_bin.143]